MQNALADFKKIYDDFVLYFSYKDHIYLEFMASTLLTAASSFSNRASPTAFGLPPGGVKKCRAAFHLATGMWQCCHTMIAKSMYTPCDIQLLFVQ